MQTIIVLVAIAVALSNGHDVISKIPNQLQQVHELYIKPSLDGTTGDLYVAATEESGTTTQWLTDQPVHFLPPYSQVSADQSVNTKRAIASPRGPYSYTQPPAPNSEVNVNQAYPYAMAISAQTPAAQTDTKNETPCNAAASNPQYNPYGHFYPQIMSSYSNMANILKDTGMNEETAKSLVPQTPVLWPQAYAYPVQYMMVDPSAWTQSQSILSTAPSKPENKS